MSGEALTTQRSAITGFLDQLVGGNLEGYDAETAEGRQEFGARESGNFGRFSLRDLLGFVPFDGRGQPHFAWVRDGRIEIGLDEYSGLFIRVIDEGGLIWESGTAYETVTEALAESDGASGVGRMSTVYKHDEESDSDAQD